jgi:lipoyl(octanoyl) transferase
MNAVLSDAEASPCKVRELGLVDYEPVWHEMQTFTAARTPGTADEIWLVQHKPVYTLGLAGRSEHILRQTTIPIVKSDRGGQVTYHGPGQLIAYVLLDLRRLGFGVRPLVRRMEQAVADLLAEFGIVAVGDTAKPGVYVDGAKIAALGLRVKNGCCYHGLALNVNMDIAPFSAIDPCGFPRLAVTQMSEFDVNVDITELGPRLARHLTRQIEHEHA